MRRTSVALGLVFAACSSPAPSPTGTHPVDQVSAERHEAVPCLPAGAQVLYELEGVVIACASDECFGVSRDGRIARTGAHEWDRDPVSFDEAQVWPCPDCTPLSPELGEGQRVVSASLGRNDRIVIAMHDRALGKATIEVWNRKTGALVARGVQEDTDERRLQYHAWSIGDAVLVEASFSSTHAHTGTLWKVDGNALTKVTALPGALSDAHTLDASHGLIVLDGNVILFDVLTGTALGAIGHRDLVDPVMRDDAGHDPDNVLLGAAEAEGHVVISVYHHDTGELIGLGMASADGSFDRYPARLCALGDP